MPSRRRYLSALLAAGLSLILCEAALQLAARMVPFVNYQISPPWSRNQVPDSGLGYRNSPFFPGHDRRGYRNDDALDRYDIVAIGDSMTYGFGVSPESSWPRQLRTLSGRTVYNGGVGGYGPCEYERVAEELLVLKPELVIVALNVTNDIADAYRSVVLERRCPNLMTTDPATLAAMRQADDKATLRELVAQFQPETPPPSPALWKRTALYGLARSLYIQARRADMNPFRDFDDTFESATSQRFRVPMASPAPFRTVFIDPRLHEFAIDSQDPRIEEGLRITFGAIRLLRGNLERSGVHLIVAVLYSKPYVLAPVLERDRRDLLPRFQRMNDLEARATERVSRWLSANGIRFIDTAGRMRAEVSAGRMLFAESDDYHPNAAGYAAIAAVILEGAGGVLNAKRPASR
jgi:lysophospholipase L1-like esterase